MNTKKISVILIAIAFIIVLMISCIGLLAVKKIHVDYSVLSYSSLDENMSAESVQSLLDEYKGKNILFLKEKEIREKMSAHPRLEIVSFKKQFPNVLEISLKERREIYSLAINDKQYVLNEDGFILSDDGTFRQDSDIINLKLENIEVQSSSIGQKIQIEKDEDGKILESIFSIAKKVGLSDCIKEIFIKDYTNGYDAFFKTHTGVEIQVTDVMIDGEIKCLKAFEIYDNVANDYQKRFKVLKAHYTKKDEIDILAVDYLGEEYGDALLFEQPLNK